MTGFTGFSDGPDGTIPLPAEFFDRLLPETHHLLELKLVLFLFAALARRGGGPGPVSLRELAADAELLRGMKLPGSARSPAAQLREAVERAVAHGALLSVTVGDDLKLFVNSPAGRAAIVSVHRDSSGPAADGAAAEWRVTVDPQNLFLLYEQNIGLLTPIVAELIRDAADDYPGGWIREAIALAVADNRRNWRYVQRVLERWAREGRDDGAPRQLSEKPTDAAGDGRVSYERFVQS